MRSDEGHVSLGGDEGPERLLPTPVTYVTLVTLVTRIF
jgi:hypothetical protein